MTTIKSDKSKSVIDTSLTELAFVFFFILLAFSALKFVEFNNEKKVQDEKIDQLLEDNRQKDERLIETMLPIRDVVHQPNVVDPDKIFEGLGETKDRVLSLAKEHQRLTKIASEVFKDGSNSNEIIAAFEKLKELANGKDSSFAETLRSVETQILDLKGQNSALRRKVEALGNGLEYPPCWADPQTGKPQYVYDVTILENSIGVAAAWPKSRESSVELYPFIRNPVGNTYAKSSEFWVATKELYEQSVTLECRHFVRIYDKAISKESFKSYLLGIERHFYKLLL